MAQILPKFGHFGRQKILIFVLSFFTKIVKKFLGKKLCHFGPERGHTRRTPYVGLLDLFLYFWYLVYCRNNESNVNNISEKSEFRFKFHRRRCCKSFASFWSLDEVVGDLRSRVCPSVCASRFFSETIHYFFLKRYSFYGLYNGEKMFQALF